MENVRPFSRQPAVVNTVFYTNYKDNRIVYFIACPGKQFLLGEIAVSHVKRSRVLNDALELISGLVLNSTVHYTVLQNDLS